MHGSVTVFPRKSRVVSSARKEGSNQERQGDSQENSQGMVFTLSEEVGRTSVGVETIGRMYVVVDVREEQAKQVSRKKRRLSCNDRSKSCILSSSSESKTLLFYVYSIGSFRVGLRVGLSGIDRLASGATSLCLQREKRHETTVGSSSLVLDNNNTLIRTSGIEKETRK